MGKRRFVWVVTRKEEFLVLGRPGSDLLSQGLSHSTIGAEEFNGRVRDGIGFKLLARTTRPAKDKDTKQAVGLSSHGSRRAQGRAPHHEDHHPRPSSLRSGDFAASRRMMPSDGH